jgi:hypothetical protein
MGLRLEFDEQIAAACVRIYSQVFLPDLGVGPTGGFVTSLSVVSN